jgi:hypothetical protein
MKYLIYALQSSGSSLFAFWLSQQPNFIGLIDILDSHITPSIDYPNIVAKCTITELFTFEQHKKSFKPDKTVLFVRNPVENYLSLSRKTYKNSCGSIESKFRIFENYFNKKELFDHVVFYEQFILKNIPRAIGSLDLFSFKRSIKEIVDFNFSKSNWCKENFKKKWDIGNIDFKNINSFEIDKICNFSCKHYCSKIKKIM